MPKFNLECTYCGHKWQEIFWNQEFINSAVCINGQCNDKNIRVKQLTDNGDAFGYKYERKFDKKNAY